MWYLFENLISMKILLLGLSIIVWLQNPKGNMYKISRIQTWLVIDRNKWNELNISFFNSDWKIFIIDSMTYCFKSLVMVWNLTTLACLTCNWWLIFHFSSKLISNIYINVKHKKLRKIKEISRFNCVFRFKFHIWLKNGLLTHWFHLFSEQTKEQTFDGFFLSHFLIFLFKYLEVC